MSIYAYTYVWETSRLTGTALLMMLALADFAHQDTGECFPSIPTLAKMLRMSDRNVQHLLKRLSNDNSISIIKGKGQHTDSGSTNRYVLCGYKEWKQAVKDISSLGNQEVKNSVSRGEILGSQEVKGVSPKPYIEPSLEPSEKRKRSTPRTKSTEPEPIHPLIQAWATIRKIDATNIGAPIYSRNDLALAKRMAKWDVPPTCDEITFAIQSSKTPQKYHFRYLEADIPQHRLAKTPPPVATTATGETYFEHARRQGRAMFFGEDE